MGFFSSFFNAVEDIGGGLLGAVKGGVQAAGQIVNRAADAIAEPLGVHPDAVKAAAALLGYSYINGSFINSAGEAVADAVVAEAVAPVISSSGVIGAAAPAAGAGLSAAELAALDAGLGGLPVAAPVAAPVATAFPVATAPLAPINSLGSAGIDASLGQAYNALGVGANALAPAAGAAALSPEVLAALSGAEGLAVPASAFTGAATLPAAATLNPESIAALGGPETLAAPSNMGFGTPVGYGGAGGPFIDPTLPVATAPLAPMSTYTAAELAALDAGLGGVGANALAPTAAATAAGVNALSPEALAALDAGLGGVPASAAGTAVPGLNFEQIAAESLGANVPGVAEGVSGSSVFTPATAATTAVTNALTPPLNHEQIAAESLGANLPGVAEGVSGAATFLPGTTGLTLDALSKFAKDYGVPLSSLISGITGSQAAKDAANVQAESAREARALARQIFDEQKALQEPFRTAGISAQNQLLTLLGLPGGTQGAEFGRYARPFGMQDFQADPGYAFRLSEGMKALEASRAARGGLLSGATGKALSRYGQDLASQEYGNAFNRYQTERVNRLQPLGALMGTGQAAASNQGAAAGQYGQTAGALTTDIGAARAAGDVGAANAITNALGQYSRYLSNQNIANQIRQSMYGAAIPG